MTFDELVALYGRVMGPELVLEDTALYTLRQWDGMDGSWTDFPGLTRLSADTILRGWVLLTDNGTHHIRFREIDYYKIFPAGSEMLYSGVRGMFW